MQARKWSVVLAIAAVGACAARDPNVAPPPQTVTPVTITGSGGGIGSTEIRNDPRVVVRTIPAPLDAVWDALPKVYQTLDIPQAGADPGAKLFGNPQFRPRRIAGERMSAYLDCGAGFTAVPKADEYEVTISVLTRLTPDDYGGTVAATTVTATAKPRAESGNPVYCASKGTLETRVTELLLQMIRAGR